MPHIQQPRCPNCQSEMKLTRIEDFHLQATEHAQHTTKPLSRERECEDMFSALPLRVDIAQCSLHVRFVPNSVSRGRGLLDQNDLETGLAQNENG